MTTAIVDYFIGWPCFVKFEKKLSTAYNENDYTLLEKKIFTLLRVVL